VKLGGSLSCICGQFSVNGVWIDHHNAEMKKALIAQCFFTIVVPGAGLEPARLAAGDFEPATCK